jgi:hypothetical protein
VIHALLLQHKQKQGLRIWLFSSSANEHNKLQLYYIYNWIWKIFRESCETHAWSKVRHMHGVRFDTNQYNGTKRWKSDCILDRLQGICGTTFTTSAGKMHAYLVWCSCPKPHVVTTRIGKEKALQDSVKHRFMY